MMMCLCLLFFHVSVIFVTLTPINATGIPEILSYAKVSRSGMGTPILPITSTQVQSSSLPSEGRNFQASPLYEPSKITKLRNGEVIDFPSNKPSYSTLDREMVAKLDGKKYKQQAQDRFHPPAGFEHALAHSNKLKYQDSAGPDTPNSSQASSGPGSSMSSGSYDTLPKHLYSDTYNYQPGYKPVTDNLPSITIDDYPPDTYNSKPSDSYTPSQESYSDHQLPSYLEKFPSKPQYSGPFDHPTFDESSYSDDHDHYPHELIYDHPPDHHHHDHTTTEQPEMNDQRLNKRPYSYYYIGKKLWYLPLYFSIYFIIYIAALVLKSIARHKIDFPANLAEAAGARHIRGHEELGWWDLTKRVLDAIDQYASENLSISKQNSTPKT